MRICEDCQTEQQITDSLLSNDCDTCTFRSTSCRVYGLDATKCPGYRKDITKEVIK